MWKYEIKYLASCEAESEHGRLTAVDEADIEDIRRSLVYSCLQERSKIVIVR